MKIEGLVFCGSSCTVIPTKHSIVYFLPRSTFSLFHDLFNGRSYFAFIFRKFFFFNLLYNFYQSNIVSRSNYNS